MSTVITIAICGILFITIGYALVKGLWSAAKKIAIPIQIALFVVMLVCVCRLFCTKENAKKLYDGIEQSGISQNVENTMRTALKMKPVEASKPEPAAAVAESAPAVTPPPAQAVSQVAAPSPAPAVATVADAVPAPVKSVDYSHLNKGKQSFSYALPFNAKVTVGFKDNTYRVISESLGNLSASEKKEVGKLILTSLGKYAGKTIDRVDKSKMSIEERYDESDGRTRVFAVIQPDAID